VASVHEGNAPPLGRQGYPVREEAGASGGAADDSDFDFDPDFDFDLET
jgi:hypothetical protein